MTAPVGEKWAVLIGINSYMDGTTERFDKEGDPIEYLDLKGCVEDILQVEQYLLQSVGIEKSRITKLLSPWPVDSQIADTTTNLPTYSRILEVLDNVTLHAKEGDTIYIHYSGHGARATTVFPNLKGHTALDDVLVPADIVSGGHYLRDLEIALLLKKMVDKGLLVTVVLDCCHSASATRGPRRMLVRSIPTIYQSISKQDIPKSAMDIARSLSMDDLREPRGYTLLAACRPHEEAREERFDDDKFHGILTYWLLDTLRSHSPDVISSYILFRRVCARVKDMSALQTPILAGDSSRLIFENSYLPTKYAITIRGLHGKVEEGDTLDLAGGRLHGVRIEAEYLLFPVTYRGTECESAGQCLGRVIVKEVSALKCTASVIELNTSNGEIEMGCPAILISYPASEKATVRFISSSSNNLAEQQFRDEWMAHFASNAWLSLVDGTEETTEDFRITINDDDEYQVQSGAGDAFPALKAVLRPLKLSHQTSMLTLVQRIQHLAKFSMIKILENPDITGLRRGHLLVEAGRGNEDDETVFAKLDEKDGCFEAKDGDLLRLRFTNRATFPLNFTLFNLTPLFGVDRIFPEYGEFETLDPGQQFSLPVHTIIPPELREYSRAGLPIIDTLKAIVTVETASLGSLILDDIHHAEERSYRGGAHGNLERLRKHGYRNVSIASRLRNQWQTVDLRLNLS
ncbi:hypothetical protein N7475_000162 [Penicillium sp. IBT 31633x]|nr:hypothetical protein N7475_000162 [Penicillium sp. IBT 31633x]